MSYAIAPSEDGTYIFIKVVGSITRKDAMTQNVEAHALGRKLSIHKYLVDLTEARNTESPLEAYGFAHTDMPAAEGIDLHARVAMIVHPEDHSHDFIETVSRNAGMDVTLFRDRAAALRHLLGERAS